MSLGPTAFERIRRALAETDLEEPLTAREITRALQERGLEFESSHQVATVLGRHARRGDVEVIEDQPYRYRIHDAGDGRRSLHDDRPDRRTFGDDSERSSFRDQGERIGFNGDSGDRHRTDGGSSQRPDSESRNRSDDPSVR